MGLTKDINIRANVKQKSEADIPVNASQPVEQRDSTTSTAAQTVIPLTFKIDQADKSGFELYVDGALLSEGASKDYTFTSVDANNMSSEVTLNSPMIAGLNIEAIKRGIKQEKEFQTDNRFIQLYEASANGLNDFIKEELMSPSNVATFPYSAGEYRSSIVGRKAIRDPRLDLGSRMGIERIMTHSIQKLQDEFGPNGEPVYSVLNDSLDRIRFVGSNWANTNTSFGSGVLFPSGGTAASDYMEVTFYGTGLDLLFNLSSFATFDVRVTIDDNTEGGNIMPASASGILAGRNYNNNTVFNIANGLALGLHTIKIRNVEATGYGPIYTGFEILNESSNILTNPGTSFQQLQKVSSSAQDLSAYNAAFTNITRDGASQTSIANRGGRVLVYQNTDGSIAKDIIETDSLQRNLVSADHSNEEVIRTYNFREFGAGRADDFSTLIDTTASDRAFTLDDGTTTLVGNSVRELNEGLEPNLNSDAFITLTFVGTGLDITWDAGAPGTNANANAFEYFVDGVSIGNHTTVSNGVGNIKLQKVVSGLPYGTHSVKIFRNVPNVWSLVVHDFIVYGPKKPKLPSGAMKIADYYLIADFIANSTAGTDRISTGVLRKTATREITYQEGTGGANWLFSFGPQFVGGYATSSTHLNSKFKYTFFGTGFDSRYQAGTNRSTSVQVKLNGLNASVGVGNNFPTASSFNYGIHNGFTDTTGILNQDAVGSEDGNGFGISGLPLGLYVLEFDNLDVLNNIIIESIDVITPIHSPKSNLPGNLQDALSVGSTGLNDLTNYALVKEDFDLPNYTSVQGITSTISLTATAFIPMTDMQATIKTNGNPIEIHYDVTVSDNSVNADTVFTQMFVDGEAVGTSKSTADNRVGFAASLSDSLIVPLSKGVHHIQLMWFTNASPWTSPAIERGFTVKELK